MTRIVNLLFLLLIPGVCLSAEPDEERSRWYFGASAGISEVEVVGHDRSALVSKALQKKGIQVTSSSGSQVDDDAVYALLAGFRFHRFGSAELQFIDLGEVSGRFSSIAGADSLTGTIDSSYRAASLSLVGALPVYTRLDLIARAGILYWEHEFNLEITASSNSAYIGQSSTLDDDGVDVVYGIGAQVTILENLQARLEWTRYHGVENEDGIDAKSLSLLFNF